MLAGAAVVIFLLFQARERASVSDSPQRHFLIMECTGCRQVVQALRSGKVQAISEPATLVPDHLGARF